MAEASLAEAMVALVATLGASMEGVARPRSGKHQFRLHGR